MGVVFTNDMKMMSHQDLESQNRLSSSSELSQQLLQCESG